MNVNRKQLEPKERELISKVLDFRIIYVIFIIWCIATWNS